MHQGPTFGVMSTRTTHDNPIDAALRRAHRARQVSRRGLPILRPLTARLLWNGEER
jgi:hypothetical protein